MQKPQCRQKIVYIKYNYYIKNIKTTKNDPLKIANYFNFINVPNKLVKSLPPKKKHYSEYLKFSTCQSMFTWPTCFKDIS